MTTFTLPVTISNGDPLDAIPVMQDFDALADFVNVLAALIVTNYPPSFTYAAPTTGATLTATAGLGAYVLNPAAEIATLTIVMPPTAVNTQIFEVSTTQNIDALTMSPAATQAIAGTAAGPFVLAANGGASWRFRSADSTWYPRY